MWKHILSQLKPLSLSQSSVCAYTSNFRSQMVVKNRQTDSTQIKTHAKGFKKHITGSHRHLKSRELHGNPSHSMNLDDDTLDEEDFDEEVDIYKYHHLRRLEEQDQEKHRELVKMKIIEKKYFSSSEKEKKLSWSDKEHVRYLHNTDPQKWTIEVLADQFQVDKVVIKKVAKSNWLPKKQKVTYEGLQRKTTNLLLDEGQSGDKVQKSFQGKRKMSFKEFCAEGGIIMPSKPGSVNPTSIAENQDFFKPSPTETLLNYVEGSSKWTNETSNSNLRLDVDRAGNTNIYCYDNRHGYQHPFGRSEIELSDERIPIVKEGELYRRGETFYDEDGEILFRVPGFSGNKS